MSQQGQEDYWRQAAAEYGAALARLAWGYEADPDRRRDLLQEIHLALWRSLANFDARCSLRTWVYRVAHNVALPRHLAKKSRSLVFLTLVEAEAQPAPQNVEELAGRQEAIARVLALVQRLELIDRQLILSYLERPCPAISFRRQPCEVTIYRTI